MTQYPFEKTKRKLYQIRRQKMELEENEKNLISEMIIEGYDIRDGILFGGVWIVEPSCDKTETDIRVDRISRMLSTLQGKKDEIQSMIDNLEGELKVISDGDSVKEKHGQEA